MVSRKSIALLLLGCSITGCQFERPYGYYQVWADHHSLGDHAVFLERVRTDNQTSNGRVYAGLPTSDGYTSQSLPPTIDGLWVDPELSTPSDALGRGNGAGCEAPQHRQHIEPQSWLFRR